MSTHASEPLSLDRFFDLEVHLQILDVIEDMILIKGPKSRLLWANKAFRELYGMTNAQLQGMIDAPWNEPDFTLQYIKDDAYVFERGEVLVIPEEPVTRHDGEVRTLRTVKAPLRSADGQVIATVGISHDITERKRREAQDTAIQEQRGLIERQQKTISAMATPIIEIWEGVLTIPLIGIVDSGRAADIMSSLLHAIVEKRSRVTIVDLTGVELVDTSTANHLINLVRAASLLGTTCVLSGISPSVSMTMVSLGVDFGRLHTFGTLRAALRYALRKLGVTLVGEST